MTLIYIYMAIKELPEKIKGRRATRLFLRQTSPLTRRLIVKPWNRPLSSRDRMNSAASAAAREDVIYLD